MRFAISKFSVPSAAVPELSTILPAAVGVLFIGLSKAGFGGGLGMLTTPLCVLAFGAGGRDPSFAIGTLLPLLCAGDAFSLYHYWGKWERKNMLYLLPGVVVGRRARLRKVIVADRCKIPEGLVVGEDRELDEQRFYVSRGGVTLVTPAMLQALGSR